MLNRIESKPSNDDYTYTYTDINSDKKSRVKFYSTLNIFI